jgi:two-component system, NarL family, nitrate/nitrite response regulator NarL
MSGVVQVAVMGGRRGFAEALATCICGQGASASAVPPGDDVAYAHVLLLDLMDDDANALSRLPRRGSNGPPIRTVAIGVPRPNHDGIDAWVSQDATVADLLAAIHGDGSCRPPVAAARTNGASVHLTPREEQVLAELLAGGDTVGMAERLSVSPQTLRTHVQNILRKLGVSSRAQAAAWAVKNGRAIAGPDERQAS